jgi:ankyrin repeat protein
MFKKVWLLFCVLCVVSAIFTMDTVDFYENTDLTENERALFYAVQTGDKEGVLSLLQLKVNVNVRNSCGSTPLLMALIHKQKEIAAMLVEAGADGGAKNIFHNTPLWYACKYKMIDFVRLFLSKEVNVNAIVDTYHTSEVPLIVGLISQERNHPFPPESEKIIKLLMKKGATINTQAYFRLSRSDDELLYLLSLKKSETINNKNKEGNTLLHTACLRVEYRGYVEFLVKNGALVNEINNEGNTPLHLATMAGATDSVAYLLAHNADHLIINNNKKTASESLKRKNTYEEDPIFEKIQQLIKNKESMHAIQKRLGNKSVCNGIYMRQLTGT